MWDLIRIQQDAAAREIQAAEDKRFFDLALSYTIIGYLCKALRDLPDTRWKRLKYRVGRLFGKIK